MVKLKDCSDTFDSCPLLEEKYSKLKQSIVKPEHKIRLIESYQRLKVALEKEANRIESVGSRAIPEIDFSDIEANNGRLPDGLVDIVRQTGCLIIRGVVPEEQAVKWEKELKQYTQKHTGVSGFPKEDPQSFSLFWTKPQVEIRSHPRVLSAMQTMSEMWHLSRDDALFDMKSQVAYADRFRIRHPSLGTPFSIMNLLKLRLISNRRSICIECSPGQWCNGAMGRSRISGVLQ
jgi:hypothetical protein